MYLVTAKTKATAQDFPGSTVEWAVGQTREVHDSLIQEFKNNPAAWTVSGGATTSTVTATSSAQGIGISAGGQPVPLLQDGSLLNGKKARASGRLGTSLIGPESAYSTPTTAAGANCTINAAGFVQIGDETYFQVTATFAAGAANWFEVAIPAQQQSFSSDTLQVEWQSPDVANIQQIVAYIGTTSSYTTSISKAFAVATAGSGSSPHIHKGRCAFTWAPADWTKIGFADSISTKAWKNVKLRIYGNVGTYIFNLRSVQTGLAKRKGRVAITIDDGHRSFFQMGLPMFREFGVATSLGVIPPNVGSAWWWGTKADIVAYAESGGLCYPHGPLQNDTKLFDAPYTSTSDRLADILAARQWLIDNGLVTGGGAKCYAFPQGVYASASGEPDLLEALQAAGITVARSAVIDTTRAQYYAGLSPKSHQRLTMPCIGHMYAGVAATANDATETANVTAICSALDAVAAVGGDAVLMLHKFVAPGGTTGGSGTVEIEMDRLATILTKVVALRDAGTINDVVLSDFA